MFPTSNMAKGTDGGSIVEILKAARTDATAKCKQLVPCLMYRSLRGKILR